MTRWDLARRSVGARRSRFDRAGLALSPLMLLAGAVFAESPAPAWHGVDVGLPRSGIAAVALAPDGTRLAVGGERGVVVRGASRSFETALRRGPVRDLAFWSGRDSADALLVATDAGLYRVEADGSFEQLATGQGEEARAVARLAVAESAAAAATSRGAFVSGDGRVWQRLSSALPAGAAKAVAFREEDDGFELWTVIERHVWRTRVRPEDAGLRAAPAVRESIPSAVTGDGPVDVATGLPGADVVVVYPAALAVRPAPAAEWQILRPNLPPGSSAARVASALGRVWLATDRGLLEAESLGGPWRRARGRPGTTATRAVAGDPRHVYAATESGLLVAPPPLAVAGTLPAGSVIELPSEPPIRSVHSAALAYLELGPSPMDSLRRGVARRGWLPVVSFRAGRSRSLDRSDQYDEAYLSGGLRRLRDRDDDRSDDFDLTLTFTWDFGDVAFNPEAIDVSREARLVTQLRDDVLDEVTQLYFERRRVLVQLGSRADPWDAESVALRLRADELAAGIDAWTGGWFGSRVMSLAP